MHMYCTAEAATGRFSANITGSSKITCGALEKSETTIDYKNCVGLVILKKAPPL